MKGPTVMSTATTIAFADDPIASHSAQFPLARPSSTRSDDQPSREEVRPWVLRAMAAPPVADRPSGAYSYSHVTQTAVSADGLPLVDGPTANSVTSGDGDEGPSEDWTYDFAPDSPYEV